MRRLFLILLNTAALLSLALAVVAAGLWARGYRKFDEYRYLHRDTGTLVDIVSLRGGIEVARVRNVYNRFGEMGWDWQPGWSTTPLINHHWLGGTPDDTFQLFQGYGTARSLRLLGFRLDTGKLGAASSYWSVRIPSWGLIALGLPLPVLRGLRRWTGRRPQHHGLCPNCGYDCRATPDRCPECGRKVSPA